MNFAIPPFATSVLDYGFSPVDPDTKNLYQEVEAFAKQGQSIVIFGPTGAGKEFLARHYYRTLIDTEFYKQNREDWASKFNEIKQQYTAYYSGLSLNIFLESVRTGIFQSINAATIHPNLAESILFGHEAHSFTEAQTQPGLLESIKYGVLFLDEVGELPKNLQAKLLRAVDSEINQGRRIAGRMDYSLKDIIFISATNQPKEDFRKDFYYKLGLEVTINGIDERPKDVRLAIPYFIRRAIGKRKDYATVINTFGIRGLRDIKKLSETREVKIFADEHKDWVADRVLSRSWPGNFRSLRRTIDAAVFRIIDPGDLLGFSRDFKNYIEEYIMRESLPFKKTLFEKKHLTSGSVFPSKDPKLDNRVYEKIDELEGIKDLDDYEKEILSVFLSTKSSAGFRRKDLEDYYTKQDEIKHSSQAHIRSRINLLLSQNIIYKTGNGKSTRYYLTTNFIRTIKEIDHDIFSLPRLKPGRFHRETEIKTLVRILNHSDRIFVQASPRHGKTTFISLFCNRMKSDYNFYYYPLGEEGIRKLFTDMESIVKSIDEKFDKLEYNKDPVNSMIPFLNDIFRPLKDNQPVLILDNAHLITDSMDKRILRELINQWANISIILVGNKMDNELNDVFYEFALGPWGKEG